MHPETGISSEDGALVAGIMKLGSEAGVQMAGRCILKLGFPVRMEP